MGHTWVNNLAHSRQWHEVIGLLAGGADVSQIADATLRTAEKAFTYAHVNDDEGFHQAAWIMVQMGIAAQKNDPIRHLRDNGINIPENTTLPGIISAISDAMDNHLDQHKDRSDLGEIAQRALIGAVTERMRPKLENRLFGVNSDDVKEVLGEFHKQKEFGRFSRAFFGRLTNECMDYFLSQTLNTQLGENHRFATMNEKAQFDIALTEHCIAASMPVEEYSGDWFSKHMFEESGDISRESVRGFANYGMKKMKDVLKLGVLQDAT